MKKELYLEAIQLFGKEIVGQVISMVYISDADGMYSMFQDMDMPDHAECTEFLFFN